MDAAEGRGQEVELTALTGFLRVGGSGVIGEKGFLGRLGHLAIWREALSPAAFSEIQLRGHEVDVRDPVGVYAGSDSLIHYWRLGESSQNLGYDLGFADRPLDLDDPAGGVTLADFVQEKGLKGSCLPLGFTFSFPCQQEGLAIGKLTNWTKGFKCAGVEGKDVVLLLKEALARRGDVNIEVNHSQVCMLIEH